MRCSWSQSCKGHQGCTWLRFRALWCSGLNSRHACQACAPLNSPAPRPHLSVVKRTLVFDARQISCHCPSPVISLVQCYFTFDPTKAFIPFSFRMLLECFLQLYPPKPLFWFLFLDHIQQCSRSTLRSVIRGLY